MEALVRSKRRQFLHTSRASVVAVVRDLGTLGRASEAESGIGAAFSDLRADERALARRELLRGTGLICQTFVSHV